MLTVPMIALMSRMNMMRQRAGTSDGSRSSPTTGAENHDGAAVLVAKRARSEEKAPWLQLTLAPAPAPVRAVLCSSARGATPQVVDLRELRGDGELPKLIGLMAREVLPAA